MTDGSYTCGEHNITYRLIESLCCIPETNVTLCVDYTSIKMVITNENKMKGNNSKILGS